MEKFNIYENLYKLEEGEEVKWSLHTTYNSDSLYHYAIMRMQSDKKTNTNNICIGFFYNKETGPCINIKESPSIKLVNLKDYQYPVEVDRSFHPKISLLCIEKKGENDRYRMAVMSKNQTFGYKCAEVGVILDIEPSDKRNTNGKSQLQSFFDTLRYSCDEQGKEWLEAIDLGNDGATYKKLRDYTCQLAKGSPFYDILGDRNVELYFGGCGGDPLGKLINLKSCTKEVSVVITPPEFIRNSKDYKEYFEEHKILFDLKSDNNGLSSSHAKLYLLKKKFGSNYKYELWLGSANATQRGLGWDIKNNRFISEENVEAMVKMELEKEEFVKVKELINKYYEPFEDWSKEGSLENKVKDEIGPLISEHFIISEVEYREKKIIYTFKKKDKSEISKADLKSKMGNTINSGNSQNIKLKIRPIEYSETEDSDVKIKDSNSEEISFEAVYTYKTFKPSHKILAVGESGTIIYIECEFPKDIELVEHKLPRSDFLENLLLTISKEELEKTHKKIEKEIDDYIKDPLREETIRNDDILDEMKAVLKKYYEILGGVYKNGNR